MLKKYITTKPHENFDVVKDKTKRGEKMDTKDKKVKMSYIYNGEPIKLSKKHFALFNRLKPKAKTEVIVNK